MFDCVSKVSADGRDTKKCLTVCCLEKSVFQDSFIVSKYLDNQAFTIKDQSIKSAADDCRIPTSQIDKKPVFSIKSNLSNGKTVSVRLCQSSIYSVARYVSNQIHITINVLKNVVCTAVRHLRKTFANMKGKQQGCRVYALCLLRL